MHSLERTDKYNEVVNRFYIPILKYTIQRIRNEFEAEDIVQKIFLKYHQKMDLVAEGAVKQWLYSAAYFEILNLMKKKTDLSLAEMPDKSASDERNLTEIRIILEESLSAVSSEELKEILELITIGGKTFSETAALLGFTVRQVKLRHLRALKEVRLHLKNNYNISDLDDLL